MMVWHQRVAWAIGLAWGCLAFACGGGPGGSGNDTDDATATGSTATGGTGPSGGEADGSDADSDGGDDGETGESGGPDDPGDPYAALPPFEPLDAETLTTLQSTIDGILGDQAVAGASQGVLVVDLETDQVLYDKGGALALVPASNTKMFTTAAALDVLGEDHRFAVDVFADAEPDGSGVVAGDLHIVVHHDFTWSTVFWESTRFAADRIAAAVFDAGVRSVTGSMVLRGEAVVEGESLGTYSASGERAQAAAEIGGALAGAGIAVGGITSSSDFAPSPGAVRVADWASPALSIGALTINVPSHNEFADILMRHFGHELAGQSSYAAGGAEVRTWMASLPTDTTDVVWADGSGLSHANRVSPRNIIDLLRFMRNNPVGAAWTRSLSIGGVRGTLGSRLGGADVYGRVWGKTGTLGSIGVISTSGYVFHRYDHRRYGFSMLMNGVASTSSARAVQDEVIGAFARDLRGLGPALAAPTLLSVVPDESSDVVAIEWTPVDGASGYAVWLSPDGHAFDPKDARYVTSTRHRAGHVGYSPVYVRVSAVAEVAGGPLLSEASDVYGASVRSGPASILIVDGNDRWQSQPAPENPMAGAHDFAIAHANAIGDAHAFATVANESVIDGRVNLGDYDVVVWMLGEESEADLSFDAAEQAAVTQYLVDESGNLFVSGAEIGYDLVELGTPVDAAFFGDVLRANYVGDSSGAVLAVASPGAPALGSVTFTAPATGFVDYPDRLSPASGGAAWLDYVGGVGGGAAVAYVGDYGVVVMGFPLEAVAVTAEARRIMQSALERFGV